MICPSVFDQNLFFCKSSSNIIFILHLFFFTYDFACLSLIIHSLEESFACRRRLTLYDDQCRSQYHYKRRMNIVISDLDAVNTCDRPFVRLLRIYCFEWSCHSKVFEKFQVNTLLHRRPSSKCSFTLGHGGVLYFGCIRRFIHHDLHSFEYLIYGS